MPLIDQRGRVLGRLNLIDAIVVAIALGLVPLAYGAFLMFRPEPPSIVSIEPTQVFEGQEATLRINGESLRPFLIARIGDQAEVGFLVESPTRGEIKVRDLPPGTYDIALLDRGHELVRKRAAVTVLPLIREQPQSDSAQPTQSPVITLQVIGRFSGLTRAEAAMIRSGSGFNLPGASNSAEPLAEVVAARSVEPATRRLRTGQDRFVEVQAPGHFQVRATIQVRCVVALTECRVGDRPVAENETLTLALWQPSHAGGNSPLAAVPFFIDEVRSRDMPQDMPSGDQRAVATVQVRFVASPQMVDQLRVGGRDLPSYGSFGGSEQAVLTSLGSDREATVVTTTAGGLQFQQEMVVFTATVRVPVRFFRPGPTTSTGWMYKQRLVKIGYPFSFETLSGVVVGPIVGMQIEGEEPKEVASQ